MRRGELTTERQLVAATLALGARDVPAWSDEESTLADGVEPIPAEDAATLRDAIRAGGDPLGDAFSELRSPKARRPVGATYTPPAIVEAMLRWGARFPAPARVVDPGTGSGRYLVAAGRAFPDAQLVGVEIDPLASMIARAHIASAGLAARATIEQGDFRLTRLPRIDGATFFVGNPPYVRHHAISDRWKRWLVRAARKWSRIRASRLAGLHVHFLVATLRHARAGDRGAYVTAAEWIDVNYGHLVRDLVLGALGGRSVHAIDPAANPFPDAAATAAITCFEIGARPEAIRLEHVERVEDLGALDGGVDVARPELVDARRWGPILRGRRPRPEGYVELGELCRVHRGAVTGANGVWIAAESTGLPASVLFPTVTKARELFEAGFALDDADTLRRVIDLPHDLDALSSMDRRAVDRFLRQAKRLGAHATYVARRRPAWWSIGLREPAPILATYMARRPPAFVRNLAGVRHINIAHGLYPRVALSIPALDALARYLSTSASTVEGRTYAGGLTKFEPREMERLLVPDLPALS